MLSLAYDQQNKSAPLCIMSSKFTELVWNSLIQSLFFMHRCYTLRILNNIEHSLSLFICVAQFQWVVWGVYRLVFWFENLHAMLLLSITDLLISLLLRVNILKSLQSQLLWCWKSMIEHKLTRIGFQTIYLFVFESLIWIAYRCCSHNYASPWANQRESRIDDTRKNSNRDSPFDYVNSAIAATNST